MVYHSTARDLSPDSVDIKRIDPHTNNKHHHKKRDSNHVKASSSGSPHIPTSGISHINGMEHRTREVRINEVASRQSRKASHVEANAKASSNQNPQTRRRKSIKTHHQCSTILEEHPLKALERLYEERAQEMVAKDCGSRHTRRNTKHVTKVDENGELKKRRHEDVASTERRSSGSNRSSRKGTHRSRRSSHDSGKGVLRRRRRKNHYSGENCETIQSKGNKDIKTTNNEDVKVSRRTASRKSSNDPAGRARTSSVCTRHISSSANTENHPYLLDHGSASQQSYLASSHCGSNPWESMDLSVYDLDDEKRDRVLREKRRMEKRRVPYSAPSVPGAVITRSKNRNVSQEVLCNQEKPVDFKELFSESEEYDKYIQEKRKKISTSAKTSEVHRKKVRSTGTTPSSRTTSVVETGDNSKKNNKTWFRKTIANTVSQVKGAGQSTARLLPQSTARFLPARTSGTKSKKKDT